MVHALEQRFENDAFGRVRDVFHCGNELYPVLFQGVLMDSHFILISRKPVELIDDDILPLPFAACFDHALKIRAHIVRACHCAVYISVNDEKVIVLGVVLADAKLSFNGLFRLGVAGIAGIDDSFFHVYRASFIFFAEL